MSKVSIIAKLVAAEGKGPELEAKLAELVAAADSEDGLEVYAASADNGEENVYWFFELYSDADALKVHGKGDEMKAAMGALGPFLAGRPEVHVSRPVVAKGLEF